MGKLKDKKEVEASEARPYRNPNRMIFLKSLVDIVMANPKTEYLLFAERGLIRTPTNKNPFLVFGIRQVCFDPSYLKLAQKVIPTVCGSDRDDLADYLIRRSNETGGLSTFFVTYGKNDDPILYNTFGFGSANKRYVLSVGYDVLVDEGEVRKDLSKVTKECMERIGSV